MSSPAFSIRHPIAEEFLTAMGIDHSKVRYIKIEMGVDIVTTVEVEYILSLHEMENLNDLHKKYILRVSEIEE